MNMVSNLFRGHHISQPSQATINTYVDEFAGWLASDRYSIPEIARRMNITQGSACVLLRMLCERMGPQAA